MVLSSACTDVWVIQLAVRNKLTWRMAMEISLGERIERRESNIEKEGRKEGRSEFAVLRQFQNRYGRYCL